MSLQLVNPAGQRVQAYTREDWEQLERIRRGQYFLVKNGGADEPARCGRCGRKHAYLTRSCIEQPFRGLRGALYKAARVSRDERLRGRLLEGIPELERFHPYTAHGLLGARDRWALLAFEVGAVEPIDEARALRYADALRLARVPKPYIPEGL